MVYMIEGDIFKNFKTRDGFCKKYKIKQTRAGAAAADWSENGR